jgi:WD40 repeat protein
MNVIESKFPSLQTNFRKKLRRVCAKRARDMLTTTSVTFFKSEEGIQYLLSVSLDGNLTIWNLNYSKPSSGTRKRHTNDEFVFQVKVSDQPLFDIVELDSTRLACCGTDGVMILDWRYIHANKCKESVTDHIIHLNASSDSNVPITSLSVGSGMLFAAASKQAYIWDIEDCELIGTLHNKNLLPESIQVLQVYGSDQECEILTGGKDRLCFWDGNDRRLLHEINLSDSKHDVTKQLCDLSMNIQCIKVDNDASWALIGGECSNSIEGQGFIALINIRTRSLCDFYFTREIIHDVSYHSKGIISVGNESVVSFWNLFLGEERLERSNVSLQSCHCIAVDRNSQAIAIAGVGREVSFFTKHWFQSSTLEYP